MMGQEKMVEVTAEQKKVKRNKQKGVTLIEYALIAGLIAVVAVVALESVGTNITAKFTEIAGKLSSSK